MTFRRSSQQNARHNIKRAKRACLFGEIGGHGDCGETKSNLDRDPEQFTTLSLLYRPARIKRERESAGVARAARGLKETPEKTCSGLRFLVLYDAMTTMATIFAS
jgi:hypothetical protein